MQIQSVQRAFDILQLLDETAVPTRASVIAEQVNLPRTTVIRMLATLEKVGAVQRVNESNQFQIGPKLRMMGQPKTSTKKLKEISRPFLRQLATSSGETIYLCTPAGNQVYYLDQIDTQDHILLRNWVDSYFPLHATAPGKIFLAYLSEVELNNYLAEPLKRYTRKTITETDQIRAYAKAIRQQGFGWTHEQTALGLVGVAAPILNREGEPVAAVSVGGPAFRFPKPQEEARIVQQVIQTANHIADKLDG